MKTIDKYKKWYRTNRQLIEQQFKQDANLFIALIAATSPQMSLQGNWTLALKIYKNYKKGILPKQKNYTKYHYKNVIRALNRELLQGRKVQNFYKALCGDKNAVVLDVWMLRLLKYYPKHSHNPQGGTYDKIANKFKELAIEQGFIPVELQAMLWFDYRKQFGLDYVDFTSFVSEVR